MSDKERETSFFLNLICPTHRLSYRVRERAVASIDAIETCLSGYKKYLVNYRKTHNYFGNEYVVVSSSLFNFRLSFGKIGQDTPNKLF